MTAIAAVTVGHVNDLVVAAVVLMALLLLLLLLPLLILPYSRPCPCPCPPERGRGAVRRRGHCLQPVLPARRGARARSGSCTNIRRPPLAVRCDLLWPVHLRTQLGSWQLGMEQTTPTTPGWLARCLCLSPIPSHPQHHRRTHTRERKRSSETRACLLSHSHCPQAVASCAFIQRLSVRLSRPCLYGWLPCPARPGLAQPSVVRERHVAARILMSNNHLPVLLSLSLSTHERTSLGVVERRSIENDLCLPVILRFSVSSATTWLSLYRTPPVQNPSRGTMYLTLPSLPLYPYTRPLVVLHLQACNQVKRPKNFPDGRNRHLRR